MLGAEIPDLADTPCTTCQQPFTGDPAEEIVWDAWHGGNQRYSALPHHLACAQELLPPVEPSPEMTTCGICSLELDGKVLASAVSALRGRFQIAKPEAKII